MVSVTRLGRAVAISALNLAYEAGLYGMLGAWYAGCAVVFSLHRVVDNAEPALNPAQKLRIGTLNDLLKMVRSLGWEIVSLEDLHHHLLEHHENPGGGSRHCCRLACFTFDDGYADNLTVALPIFREHQAPFTVFIATDIVERGIFYWWGANEQLILKNERIELPPTDDSCPRSFWLRTSTEKIAAYQALDEACHRLGNLVHPWLRQLYQQYGIDWEGSLDRDALTVAQVRELASDPLVTIGSHAVTHQRLSLMTEHDVRFEMEEARRRLQQWAGVEVKHFAYPFGRADACGPREFAMAKQAGFETALTTRQGNIFPEHYDYLHCLPRRSVPLSRFGLRNVLYGIQTVIEGSSRFQTC